MKRNIQRLAQQHAADPSASNRDAVVRAAVPLVRSIISRITVPDHLLASQEDLQNVGLLGLLQALDAYDPERPTPFASYAYSRVRGAVLDYLRSIDVLPRTRRQRFAQAQQAANVLRQQQGSEPEDYEIADYLEISLQDYHDILTDGQCRYTLSLYTPEGEENNQDMLVDTLADDDAMMAFEQIDRASLHGYIAKLIKFLPEREQNILALYYFENLRLREIAQLMNLTDARISQILSGIYRDLRARLKNTQALAA